VWLDQNMEDISVYFYNMLIVEGIQVILYQHQYVVQQHYSSQGWEHELMSSLLMC
jgi:hypothetical protein